MTVMRRELAWETDYLREAQCCSKFGYVSVWHLLLSVCSLRLLMVCRELLTSEDRIAVPRVIPELTTPRVLTTELVEGVPLDECCNLPQETRNKVCSLAMCLLVGSSS